jgi:hypothetical protein
MVYHGLYGYSAITSIQLLGDCPRCTSHLALYRYNASLLVISTCRMRN